MSDSTPIEGVTRTAARKFARARPRLAISEPHRELAVRIRQHRECGMVPRHRRQRRRQDLRHELTPPAKLHSLASPTVLAFDTNVVKRVGGHVPGPDR